MSRRSAADVLAWVFCGLVLAGLVFGLDRYRRLPDPPAYGPDLRVFFDATLDRARRLNEKGYVRISPDERWQLVGNWETPSETGAPRPRTAQRRAVLVLPILEPTDVELECELTPLGEAGGEATAVDVEYGVNGVIVGSATLPPEGDVLRVLLPESLLVRGDNAFFLYRASRRADPSPWLAVGSITARREAPTP